MGGFQKGTIGFAEEIKEGIVGMYKIPKEKIQKQGFGVK